MSLSPTLRGERKSVMDAAGGQEGARLAPRRGQPRRPGRRTSDLGKKGTEPNRAGLLDASVQLSLVSFGVQVTSGSLPRDAWIRGNLGRCCTEASGRGRRSGRARA